MIRVAVVGGEALVRSGIEMILGCAEDIEVVVSSDGTDAVAAIGVADPEVVLLDTWMPDRDGFRVLAELQETQCPPAVAILAASVADGCIAEGLRRGASGFILKDTEPQQLCSMIRALTAGAVVLSAKAASTMVEAYIGSADLGAVESIRRLTNRERNIVVLIAAGLSNSAISQRLHMSVGTVKESVSSVFVKLGICTRVQAAVIAERAGLLAKPQESGNSIPDRGTWSGVATSAGLSVVVL